LPLLARVALAGLAALPLVPVAQADPAAMINALRITGCGRPPAGARVRRDEQLDAVAREAARHELGDALRLADYPAAKAVVFHTKGSADDASIRRILAARDCDAVSDPQYEDIGVFRRGGEVWIVLASRERPPPPIALQADEVAQRVLELVNAARAEARDCGSEHFEAAPPLTPSAALTGAALLHARDMAQRRILSHEGSDGSTPAERVARFGPEWLGSGENVAAGQRTPEGVVAAWLGSPGHCLNIMEPRFTMMGVAFALTADPEDNPPIYWAQELAVPR
jgi:uncharacterized protein YkwD